jgi:hypothetical protein
MRFTTLLAAAAFAVLQSHAARAADVPPETYAPIQMEEGTWDADVTFFENDEPSGTAKGVQVNSLLANKHWITNDFRIPATAKFPPYQGHGVWGWDPVAKTYVNTWVDTNDLTVRIDYGYWQPKEQVMTWSSKQADGQGHFIDYRMVEEFRGATRTFTVYQLGIVKPNPHPLVRIVFTRREAGH